MRNYTWIGICLLLSVGFVACNGPTIKDDTSKIRVINVSSISGNINVYMDKQKVYDTDIQYLNYSLFSAHISAIHTIQIKDIAGNSLIDTALNMLKDKRYSWFVYDNFNVPSVKLIEEDFTPPQGSYCKLRFIHLSNDAPAIDISAQTDTSILFRNYRNGDYSPYVLFPTDAVNFNVHYTGNTVPFFAQGKNNTFKSGAFYTLILQGSIGSFSTDVIDFFMVDKNEDY